MSEGKRRVTEEGLRQLKEHGASERFLDAARKVADPPAEPMEERLRRELRIRAVELADEFDSRDHEEGPMGGTGVQDDCMDLRRWARSDAATPLQASEAARGEERNRAEKAEREADAAEIRARGYQGQMANALEREDQTRERAERAEAEAERLREKIENANDLLDDPNVPLRRSRARSILRAALIEHPSEDG